MIGIQEPGWEKEKGGNHDESNARTKDRRIRPRSEWSELKCWNFPVAVRRESPENDDKTQEEQKHDRTCR